MREPDPANLPAAARRQVVMCTCPEAHASEVAGTLLKERLVASVSVVPGVRSLYWWQGEIAEEGETLLILRTSAANLAALEARLLEIHPYDLPDILALSPGHGGDAYVAWLQESAIC